VQVDNATKTLEFTRDFYALGQFSRFVRAGSVALNGSILSLANSPLLEATQYLDPNGDRIIVFLHKSAVDSVVQADFASGASWYGTLPARSVVTWVLPPTEDAAS
jgi:glucosylceramidase